ncbi:DUF393 domain-containing protein [Bacillus sp. M6-12]|uniref:thiol-disulfide oxidoreductase DCC family protein n=1 Tax=Bacillus sp. M6-12 TaxID=2054166 RepID=UPI000C772CFF|nr:DUF393 domain-containing protein [Bacillus sp. M6-12]PLS14939.1 DUF393 domain-containing protein [Bacillus sp. M6-12]
MKDIALYDRECILCQKTKKMLTRFDWLSKIEWVSLQEYEKHNKVNVYNKKDLRRELHLLAGENKVYRGFFAVRRMMIKCPPLFLLGTLCYLPFAPLIGKPVYRYIAERRHIIFRSNCSDGKCSI